MTLKGREPRFNAVEFVSEVRILDAEKNSEQHESPQPGVSILRDFLKYLFHVTSC